MDKCPKCGARDCAAEHGLSTPSDVVFCLRRQLAAAQKTINFERKMVENEVFKLSAANERAGRMEEALRFYASEEYYSRYSPPNGPPYPSVVMDDGGYRAREALEVYDETVS